MRRAPVALVVVACIGGAACGPDLPDRLWRSEHVRYFTRAGDDSVCPAILDELEEHGQVIGDALGIARPLVTYYKYPNAVDYQTHAACGEGAAACAHNAAAHSPDAFQRHELIHVYLAPYGLPPRLFSEGAAVALSCEHYPRPTGSWRDGLTADQFSDKIYGSGGWLVGHLLRTFSKTWFVTLYGSLQFNATADEIASVFQSIYHLELDDVWAAAISGAQAPAFCPWECGRPALPADASPHALAAVCGAGATQMTVDLPGGGVTRWLLDGDGSLVVRSCDGFDTPLHAITGGNGRGALLAPLPAGTYFIDAAVHEGAPPMLSIETNALPALSSVDCASAVAVPDDVSQYNNLTLFYPSSLGPQFTTFARGDDRLAALLLTSDDPAAAGTKCTSCDGQICTTIGIHAGLGTDARTGSVLSIPPGPAVTANFFWLPGSSPDGGV